MGVSERDSDVLSIAHLSVAVEVAASFQTTITDIITASAAATKTAATKTAATKTKATTTTTTTTCSDVSDVAAVVVDEDEESTTTNAY